MDFTDKVLPEYSVIIPAYNEQRELPETLAAVRQAQAMCLPRIGETIVVDNDSTDATASIALDFGARLVREPLHKISRVRNAGARAALGRYLIFLDADTVIDPDMISQVLARLDSGRIGGGGAAIKYKDDPGFIAATQRKILTFLSQKGYWAAGAFLFCLRRAFEAVGGFDESLYASEDIELSRGLIRWGRRHNLDFCVLDTPVYTSSRKFDWFSSGEIFASQLFCQWRKKDRNQCRIWYERPDETRPLKKEKAS